MTRRTKSVFYFVGTTLLLLCLLYVGSRVADNWAAVRKSQIQSVSWLAICIVSYAASHLSTGLSWPLAVRLVGVQIPLSEGLRIGLVAQVGKYLPGNVAHYFGRSALATQAGVTLKSSGISTMVELASAMTSMVLVVTAGLLIDPSPIAWLPEISVSAILIVFAIPAGLIAVGMWLARRGAHPGDLVAPTVCIAASFGLAGLSLYALALALGFTSISLAVAISVFALAWGVGFIVPGAPAGLGIREATLLALLTPLAGPGPAVIIAVLHRVITAVVDGIAAIAGYVWMASGTLAKK